MGIGSKATPFRLLEITAADWLLLLLPIRNSRTDNIAASMQRSKFAAAASQ